jgi:DNA repair photolyase/predicted SprT family Zn-dependent metalloprotease
MRRLPVENNDALPSNHQRSDIPLQDSRVEAASAEPLKGVSWVENKSILTPTNGFLEDGYTHTLNPYEGCSNADSVCGSYCYAQHFHSITKGRPWGLYGAKRNIREAYRRDFDRLKHPRNGDPKPLRVYMSSVTDPYLAQEKQLCRTQAALEEMLSRPPDVLVIQTHTVLINRDFDLIQQLARKCELWVSITVETDMDRLRGFPPHPSKPAQRIETLKRFREAGVQTQATISPLLPLADPEQFAHALNTACNRVIIDHYEFGDGTHGARTRRTNFPQLLEQAGFGEWNNKEKLWEIRAILAGVLGEDRVLVSAAGFNAVGQAQTATNPVSQPETSNLPMVIAPPKPALVVADTKALTKPAEAQPIFRLNEQNPTPEDFNELLRRHQWEKSKPLAVLHLFLPPIIKRFFDELPLPALSWSTSSRGTLGWYIAQDGLALNHRINLNSMYASQPFAVILMALAHELCHEWQYLYGKPGKYGYHNKEFQRKCLEIGIPSTDRGHSLGMQEPFISFLRELGVDPADPTPFTQTPDDEPQPKSKGSRLKPWACHCTRVWASVGKEVKAFCTTCKSSFERQ